MFIQSLHLPLDRCPHCNIALPTLKRYGSPVQTKDHEGHNQRFWSIYMCSSCGGVTLTCSPLDANRPISNIWPESQKISASIPTRAAQFLSQAIASLHAPAGAVMLTGSSVDAMLKDKGYVNGSLYSRIDKAASEHLITSEMAEWAHEIRLDANDQRHADIEAELPNHAEAQKAIDFSLALAEFLYVLPARVAKGRKPPSA